MKLFKKKIKWFEFNTKGTTHYRIKPETENLKESDYRMGFGLNITHYFKVEEKREELGLPTGEDFSDGWDTRKGFDIAGNPLPTGYHPLHDKKIKNKKTDEIYIIDAVHKHWHFGFYLMVLIRKEGSKSHGMKYVENISSKCPTVLERIEEFKSEFEFI